MLRYYNNLYSPRNLKDYRRTIIEKFLILGDLNSVSVLYYMYFMVIVCSYEGILCK